MVHETNTDSPNEEPNTTSPLGRLSILSYGSGHMLNDITSSCWFTYLLLFLTDVGLTPRYISSFTYLIVILYSDNFKNKINFHFRNAAIVMLSGQVADAFTTIFVGELVQKTILP